MSIQAKIGRTIVAIRTANGITQEELAYGVGMSVSHLRRIEHGKGNPTLDTLIRLANELNGRLSITIDTL